MKIMYFPYGGGHGNIARCLYQGLSSKSDLEQKIIALTVSWRIFQDNGIPFGRLGDYADAIHDWDKIIEIGKRLAKDISFENQDLQYDDYCAYLGIGYYCLVEEYGEQEAEKKYASLGRRAFCPVKVMKEILSYEKPDAVVITCGVRTEKAVGIAANELGIPVIRIADLNEFEPSGSDCYTCVMNEYAREFAISSLHVSSDKVFVTGQPVFEENSKIDEAENERVRNELRLDWYDKTIVYLEQPELAEVGEMEKKLIAIAESNPDWLVIFKQHPNQNDDVGMELPENTIVLRKYPLKYLLHNCDLAITRDSTAGVEAVLLDKPLISTALSEGGSKYKAADVDYSRYGISYKIRKTDELADAVDKCLNDSDEAVLLKEKRGKFKNAANVSENVYKVLRKAVESKDARNTCL